jgi:ATP-dependent DNA helicase DinG
VPETNLRTASRSVREVLAAAVDALGGQERPGQIQMAEAVAKALRDKEHLLVQAGTGTGKSLGYLVPALLHDRRVVIATATLALQHQLVERDIPALLQAAERLDRSPEHRVDAGLLVGHPSTLRRSTDRVAAAPQGSPGGSSYPWKGGSRVGHDT